MIAISSFVAACVRYSSKLRVPQETLKSLEAIHESYGKLGVIVNDIHSFEKELHCWNKDHKEGAKLLNIVKVWQIQMQYLIRVSKMVPVHTRSDGGN